MREIEELKRRIEELEEKKSENLEGKEFEGEVVAVGEHGDYIVEVPELTRKVILTYGWMGYRPRVGDTVKVEINDDEDNLFGISKTIKDFDRKDLDGKMKTELLQELIDKTGIQEEDISKGPKGNLCSLRRSGVLKILKMLGVAEVKNHDEK